MNFAVFVVLTVVAVGAFPSASPKKSDLEKQQRRPVRSET